MKPWKFEIKRLQALGYDLDAIRAIAIEQTPAHLLIDEENPAWLALRDATVAKRHSGTPAKQTRQNSTGARSDPSKWPMLVRAIAAYREPSDMGVGDTLERLFGHLGADVLAKWFTRLTGRDCGCSNRKADANTKYRYG